MNEVTTINNNLPELPKDIADFVLINEEKLVAVKAGIRALKKAGMAQEVISQKQEEASRLSEVVLDAQCRLGELLNETPKESGGDRKSEDFKKFPMVHFETSKKALQKELGITEKKAKQYSLLAKHKDIVEKAKAEAKANDDIVSRSLVLNMIKQEQKEEKRQERLERKEFDANAPQKNYKLFTCSCGDLAKRPDLIADNSVDFIITDPPYPKEYLYCFDDLAKLALRVLKDGGSLIVMSGQSYLPDIYKMLCQEGLNYQWTLCYSMPGTSTTLWQRKCGTHWKPLIWLVKGEYKGDFIDDIVLSDKSDKDFHEWGQSESGMARIVEKFTYPNQVILDPFVGGGTTGVVAVAMQRKFIGADISHEEVEKTDARIRNN